MARSISRNMALLLEHLELEQPSLVTNAELQTLLDSEGIKTPSRVFASRLHTNGWFLATEQRGVWEFVPAAVAGAFSSNDPLLPLRSFLAKHPDEDCALALQSAACVRGHADRMPIHLEVAVSSKETRLRLPGSIRSFTFQPNLPCDNIRTVPVLANESIVVHMASRPSVVRSWQSAAEWLPDLSSELTGEQLFEELKTRPKTVSIRTGYLLQGMRPDLSEDIIEKNPPTAKTRFGSNGTCIRYDGQWQIADTILPFDPKEFESVL